MKAKNKDKGKTNVMRLLDRNKVVYQVHTYDPDPSKTGEEIAENLGEDPEKVFKTLVTRGRSGKYYVFVVPVGSQLNLRKAAGTAGEKAVSMILQKELFPLTGYVHGGCSPVGMKKEFTTFIHRTAEEFERIYVSGGRVGCQIELAPEDLARLVHSRYGDFAD